MDLCLNEIYSLNQHDTQTKYRKRTSIILFQTGDALTPPEGQNQRNTESDNLINSTNDTLTLNETFIILLCFGKTQ